MKYPLKLLEEKIFHKLDYTFLDSIKEKFPTNNAYFLVCLVEIIYNSENYDDEDVLDALIDKAYELYSNSNISSYLSEISDETC